jgi:hypothetical protein
MNAISLTLKAYREKSDVDWLPDLIKHISSVFGVTIIENYTINIVLCVQIFTPRLFMASRWSQML